ncbi:MAG: hypothetical protein KatS3mg008_2051 [Acidimicrobiales bacterium]|nr:MAG: hypothetical protein KatS3mg008_2051 [Acidimicrobiales bacterium]
MHSTRFAIVLLGVTGLLAVLATGCSDEMSEKERKEKFCSTFHEVWWDEALEADLRGEVRSLTVSSFEITEEFQRELLLDRLAAVLETSPEELRADIDAYAKVAKKVAEGGSVRRGEAEKALRAARSFMKKGIALCGDYPDIPELSVPTTAGPPR